MLQHLHIENIAVIECSDILFQPGFNALTGETGAGKSIVIDALGAVLGQRTSRDLIRTGASKAFVSAAFSDVGNLAELEENGIEPESDGTVLLQRDIYADGRNACRANGRPITVSQLHTLGLALLNIHGQHDGQQLLDEQQHLTYLDRFGHVEREYEAYEEAFYALRELKRQMDALRMDEAEKARKVDMLRHQIAELERAELRAGEEEELLARRNILRNGEKFTAAVSACDAYLNGGEDSLGAVSLLKEAQSALHGLKNLGEQFNELCNRLETMRCEVYDLAETVRDLKGEYDFSPQELDAVESRADLIYRLEKKYGPTVEAMLEFLDRRRAELDEIEYAGDKLLQLEAKEKAQHERVIALGEALSAVRKAAAKRLEADISRELSELDMAKVRFAIMFDMKEPETDGIDTVRFLMSANAGEELKGIHKIASGGELARIMLALKNVLARQDRVGTMVFDEVDTGVSGRAAQRVAEKMARVSQEKQVLCVTHLPQIAAMADTHFSVEKEEVEGRTYTRVRELDRAARQRELARLTGGENVTKTQLQGAEELLSAAEVFKKTIR